jgi:hypothetical protein
MCSSARLGSRGLERQPGEYAAPHTPRRILSGMKTTNAAVTLTPLALESGRFLPRLDLRREVEARAPFVTPEALRCYRTLWGSGHGAVQVLEPNNGLRLVLELRPLDAERLAREEWFARQDLGYHLVESSALGAADGLVSAVSWEIGLVHATLTLRPLLEYGYWTVTEEGLVARVLRIQRDAPTGAAPGS